MTILEKANQILADKEANLLPENLRNGITCLGVNGKLIELVGEEKSVIATTEEQEITPAEGYNSITKIIVRPVTNAIDGNIKAENIKIGTTILGIDGTYEGEQFIFDEVSALPNIAEQNDLTIVVTKDQYTDSTETTVFEEKIYLPEEVVFENALTDLTGYIGVKPQDSEIIIDDMTGGLTATEYNFQLQINSNSEDTMSVKYVSTDGITYTREEVSASGLFKFDDETGILSSEIPLIPYVDESLGENMYDGIGGKFLQAVIDGGFAGVYQFGETGWVRIDLDTSDATAVETDIVNGKVAYVNGERIEGTIDEIPAEQANMAGNETQSNFANVPLIKEIYSNDVGEMFVRINYVKDTLQRAGSMLMVDAPALADVIGLTADKIKAGETILGIEGTYTGETTTEPETGDEGTTEPETGDEGTAAPEEEL